MGALHSRSNLLVPIVQVNKEKKERKYNQNEKKRMLSQMYTIITLVGCWGLPLQPQGQTQCLSRGRKC